MERVRIAAIFADSERYGGESVTVCGWAKTIRDMKTFGFIELNDGSCFRNLQVVMDANSLSNYKEIAAQNVGAALIVRGTVVLTPEAKQPLEVKATEIEIAAKHILRTKEKLNSILAERTGQPLDVIVRDTDRDNYMTAEEAKSYGLIDQVIAGH